MTEQKLWNAKRYIIKVAEMDFALGIFLTIVLFVWVNNRLF